jgi:hypothetical protein
MKIFLCGYWKKTLENTKPRLCYTLQLVHQTDPTLEFSAPTVLNANPKRITFEKRESEIIRTDRQLTVRIIKVSWGESSFLPRLYLFPK